VSETSSTYALDEIFNILVELAKSSRGAGSPVFQPILGSELAISNQPIFRARP